MYRMNNRGPKIAGTLRDTALDGLHWRASLIELDKLLAAIKSVGVQRNHQMYVNAFSNFLVFIH